MLNIIAFYYFNQLDSNLTTTSLTTSKRPTKPTFKKLIESIFERPIEPAFNPLSPPINQGLKPLEGSRIEAEIKSGFVIHKAGRFKPLGKWKIVVTNKHTPAGSLLFEKQSSGSEWRNVHKIPLEALDSHYIEAINTFLKLRNQLELLTFQGWYWDGQNVCLVTEHFEPITLAEYIKGSGLQARSNARMITTQLLKGLAVMHEKRIYDCVLGLQNVFITSRSPICAKICYLKAPEMIYRSPTHTQHTICGAGKPISALAPDRRAQNLWSVGCILYHLLTSNVPFNSASSSHYHIGDTDRQIFSNYFQAENNHPSKALLISHASKAGGDLVKKLLTIGHLSAQEALGHPWISETITSVHKLRLTIDDTSFSKHSGSTWRHLEKNPRGVLQAPSILIEDNLAEQMMVKNVTLNKYFEREVEYEREVEILAKLRQRPHSFVQFIGLFEHSGHIHFVMEYAECGNLSKYMSDLDGECSSGVRECSQAVRMEIGEIVRQVLEGLVYVQEKGIHYNDLRPTNVVFFSTFPMRVKLQISAFQDTGVAAHKYMAPELLGLQPPAVGSLPLAADSANMWSLGCLVYRVLAGKDLLSSGESEPFEESILASNMQVLAKYCSGNAKLPITTVELPGVSWEWLQFLQATLVLSPTARQSSKAVLETSLLQTIKITNPHRWRVLQKDMALEQQTQSGKTSWKFHRWLRGGSMATVSVMSNPEVKDYIVIKELAKYRSGNEKDDYKREITILIRLRDDTDLFVKFLGWYEDHRHVYIVMEYIEGGDLERYLAEKGKDARSDAKEISIQLLEGLEFLHELGICHRDLKPQNVLVASQSPVRVKLADFGFAKLVDGSALKSRVGTPAYQAPELNGMLPSHLQPQGSSGYTNALDIWSLGCLIHRMLALETPFLDAEDGISESGCSKGDSYNRYVDFELLKRFCYGEMLFPNASLKAADVSDDGIDFVEKLLIPDPKKRLTANQALSHRWLSEVHDSQLPESYSKVIRGQLSSIGVNISQRTADFLVMEAGGLRSAGSKSYLPYSMLTNIRTLQDISRSAGLTSLLDLLLRIRAIYNPENSTIEGWVMSPRIISGATHKRGRRF